MTLESTFCRLCDSRCGLKAEVANDRIVGLHPDSDDPVGAGFICDVATQSIDAIADATRVTEPMKRVGGHLTPVGWDQAIDESSQLLEETGMLSPDIARPVQIGAEIAAKHNKYRRAESAYQLALKQWMGLERSEKVNHVVKAIDKLIAAQN